MATARLLDLTRLVSRLGRGPLTGIDRVELAYLTRFLEGDPPVFGLIRSAAGFLLLDHAGCDGLARLARGEGALPAADLISWLLHRKDRLRARAETAARRLAMARAARPGLARLLRHMPTGAAYYNVGHTNLSARDLGRIKAAGLRITVMIHDTIPLDHPEFARPDTVPVFRRKLASVAAHADRLIHLTEATRQKTEAQLARLGRVPPGLVAPLGVEVPEPGPLPAGLVPVSPYFVTLGTIEPRKNHALLLDVWARLPKPAPQLFILGNRGWAGPELIARLDALPKDGPVQERNGLADSAVATLIAGAAALLAPSRAEGFGLPPVEAACLGTAVIATDLPVTRELLGNKAVYLPPDDIYSWMETIIGQATNARTDQTKTAPPSFAWADHFNAALSLDG